MQDHILDNPDVDKICARFNRDEKQDCKKAIELAFELADKLNTLHPKAFNYAIFTLNKM